MKHVYQIGDTVLFKDSIWCDKISCSIPQTFEADVVAFHRDKTVTVSMTIKGKRRRLEFPEDTFIPKPKGNGDVSS